MENLFAGLSDRAASLLDGAPFIWMAGLVFSLQLFFLLLDGSQFILIFMVF